MHFPGSGVHRCRTCYRWCCSMGRRRRICEQGVGWGPQRKLRHVNLLRDPLRQGFCYLLHLCGGLHYLRLLLRPASWVCIHPVLCCEGWLLLQVVWPRAPNKERPGGLLPPVPWGGVSCPMLCRPQCPHRRNVDDTPPDPVHCPGSRGHYPPEESPQCSACLQDTTLSSPNHRQLPRLWIRVLHHSELDLHGRLASPGNWDPHHDCRRGPVFSVCQDERLLAVRQSRRRARKGRSLRT
mmetsp:Transcript_35208/g.99681  ORF Transcript_35208/g.99681 Transcript_35208/m.99681 type:complete len:238 (+) Transcript_35208:1501-2214(+)